MLGLAPPRFFDPLRFPSLSSPRVALPRIIHHPFRRIKGGGCGDESSGRFLFGLLPLEELEAKDIRVLPVGT